MTKNLSTPKRVNVPEEQIPIRWICNVCCKNGIFTIPKNSAGQIPFDVALGIHRTMSLRCKMHDVTLTAGKDRVLQVVMSKDKSVLTQDAKKVRSERVRV